MVNLNLLNIKIDYSGVQQLKVGSGEFLNITCVGTTLIPSLVSCKYLPLMNVLCGPSITKNLIGLSKLTIDNNICIEFFPKILQYRDRETHKILLEGTVKGGLYQLCPSRHVSSCTTSLECMLVTPNNNLMLVDKLVTLGNVTVSVLLTQDTEPFFVA